MVVGSYVPDSKFVPVSDSGNDGDVKMKRNSRMNQKTEYYELVLQTMEYG